MKEEKYTTSQFENAVIERNYKLLSIHKRKSNNVSYAFGLIPIVRRLRAGNYSRTFRKVRWEADGRCFVPGGSTRIRKYDLKIDCHEP